MNLGKKITQQRGKKSAGNNQVILALIFLAEAMNYLLIIQSDAYRNNKIIFLIIS